MSGKFRLGKLAAYAAFTLAVSGSAAYPQTVQDMRSSGQIYQTLADQIISGLSAAGRLRPAKSRTEQAVHYFKQTYAYIYGDKQRVAIWPFQKDNIPIPKQVADGFNDKLLAALLSRTGGRYEFVARDALKAIIADLEQTGGLDQDGDPIAALMKRARDIDILVAGRVRLTDKGLTLGYKAVRVDGTILAQTDRLAIALSDNNRSQPDNLLTLDQAVKAAARRLTELAPELEEIRLGGVRYQSSGLHPPFGRYLQDRMAAALQNAFAVPLSGRVIKIRDSSLMRDIRGVKVTAKDLSESRFSNNRASYLFTGSYWLMKNAIELRFSLQNPLGERVSWTGRIRPESTDGLALKPKGNFNAERENDGLGPFEFQLTSASGKDPVYRVGENLDLLLRVGTEAWVYCFYHQADGKIIQILPNPHFWKRFNAPRFDAAKVHTIPGKTFFPFDLTITLPTGRELVKCYAAARDVTKDLPDRFRGLSLSPMSSKDASVLSSTFRQLPYAAVNEASLVITVLEKPDNSKTVPEAIITRSLSSKPANLRGVDVKWRDKPYVDIPIRFDFDSDAIRNDQQRQIREVVRALNSPSLKSAKILIEGHTDDVGGEKYNLALSHRRAESVRKNLISVHGVDPGKLDITGYGESQPVASNDHDGGRAKNRRVTFVNIGAK